MNLGAFKFQLAGYPPAFRDSAIELVNEASGAVRKVTPYQDGSADVRDLEPGAWQVRLLHPNVIGEVIDSRRIHLYPGLPTRVTLPISPSLFKDTPVRDVPDADLSPVHKAAAFVEGRVEPLAGKQPGDPIRAEDWNAMATAVADLAKAVGQLTRLVAPRGHDHDELVEKIDEVNGNVRTFVDLFGKQLNQIQRALQTSTVRKELEELDLPELSRVEIASAIERLDGVADADARTFARAKRDAYRRVAEEMSKVRADPEVAPEVKEAASFAFVHEVASAEADAAPPENAAGEARGFAYVNAQTQLLKKAFAKGRR